MPPPSPAPPVRTFAGLEPRGLTGRNDARAAKGGVDGSEICTQQRRTAAVVVAVCLFWAPLLESRVPRPARTQARPFGVFLCPALFVPDATAYVYARNDSLRRDGVPCFSNDDPTAGSDRTIRSPGLNLSSPLPSVFLERLIASLFGS